MAALVYSHVCLKSGQVHLMSGYSTRPYAYLFGLNPICSIAKSTAVFLPTSKEILWTYSDMHMWLLNYVYKFLL